MRRRAVLQELTPVHVILLVLGCVLSAGFLAYQHQITHNSLAAMAEIAHWDHCPREHLEMGVCVKYRFTHLGQEYVGSGQLSMQEWSRTKTHVDVRFLPAYPSLNELASGRLEASVWVYSITILVLAVGYAVAYGIRIQRALTDKDMTKPLGLDKHWITPRRGQ